MSQPSATFLAGERVGPDTLAGPVLDWLAVRVGGRFDHVAVARGGMSTGFAAVVRGPAGAVFAKAGRVGANPFADEALLHEMAFHAGAPLPGVPALLDRATLRDGDDTWLVAVFACAPGATVTHPWSRRDLVAVLDAWTRVAPGLTARGAGEDTGGWRHLFESWPAIAADPGDPWNPAADAVAEGDVPTRDVSRWTEPTSSLLRDPGPQHLAHTDLRADNVLLARDGDRVTVSFVDWAHPHPAPAWLDPLLPVLDAAGSGADPSTGGDVDLAAVWRSHPVTAAWPASLLAVGAANLAAFLHQRRHSATFPQKAAWARAMSENLIRFAERLAQR